MTEQMPSAPQENPETAETQTDTPETATPELTSEQMSQLGKVAAMLQKRDIDPGAIDEINKIRVSEWQVVTKSTVEGKDPTVHTLQGTNLEFKPVKAKVEPTAISEKLFANRAAPTIVRPGKRLPKLYTDLTALVPPDHQIGYRTIDGEVMEIHDESAMDISQQLARHLQPDKIIILGDNIDLPNMSRFESDPNFLKSTQASIDRFHLELARYRANAPNARIIVLEGNHDERWTKYVRNNAAEVLGIRRANAARELGVLTLPYLLRVEELDVEYLPGYPANRYWLNNNLKAIHGHVIRSGGSTAAAVAKDETTSTLFGHIHRIESHHRTVNERGGGRVISAHSFGTLSRIDGAVPSFGYGRDERGMPLKHYENWQQGVGVVTYKEGDGHHDIQTVQIRTFNDYETTFDGRVFRPTIGRHLRSVPDAA
jgi:predicted MPP superfamily phosphohydrolase